MRGAGFEPASLAALEPKSRAFANFANRASFRRIKYSVWRFFSTARREHLRELRYFFSVGVLIFEHGRYTFITRKRVTLGTFIVLGSLLSLLYDVVLLRILTRFLFLLCRGARLFAQRGVVARSCTFSTLPRAALPWASPRIAAASQRACVVGVCRAFGTALRRAGY